MRRLLELVVRRGGRNARINGYRIGGRPKCAGVRGWRGVRDTHIGSFLGFAPADDPQVAVIVIVDEAGKRPDFARYFGAVRAEILQKTLAYLGYAPATGRRM
jgi:stage V sporulation protein D (sporulation-specific penicillin-binding protein)